MPYYNKNLDKLNLDTNNMEYLNCGDCAQIFHDENIIFKKYFDKTENKYRLKYPVFNILREIHNPHFMEIYDIYTNYSIFQSLIHKIIPHTFRIDAYSAKYYDNNIVNVLDNNIDYILDNGRELEELFNTFSENGIVTDDVKRENAVLSPEGIIIIDPDLFYISNSKVCEITKENKKNLYSLFDDIFYTSAIMKADEFSEYDKYFEFLQRVTKLFDDIKITCDTCVTYEISKKLEKVKRPIDLFYK